MAPEARKAADALTPDTQAAATRTRIIAAGAELVRGFTSWDWAGLTFRAVADRAGVSERTVYRHFPSERYLHDAVMVRLEDDAGITYDDVDLDNLADVTARVFASLRRFAIRDSIPTPDDPAFIGADRRCQQALLRAVTAAAPHLPDTERRTAAGFLDVLWSPTSYERLVRVWKLADADAVRAVAGLIGTVVEGIDEGKR